jgi:integrase
MAHHAIAEEKVRLYKRPSGHYWQCYAEVGGKTHRTSTKHEDFALAAEFAKRWHLELRGMNVRGEIRRGKTFGQAAEQYLREFKVLTAGERHPLYVQGHDIRLRLHLLPYFGDRLLSEVNSGLIYDYRIHRAGEVIQAPKSRGKTPSRNTIHQEIVLLRQILKMAMCRGWINALPDLSAPYAKSAEISHRAWFSPEEYRALYEETRRRARAAKKSGRFAWERAQLHDFVRFMANTGLRPDEAWGLQYRDVKVVFDEPSQETILEIEVRGKRGVGYCKSTANAVRPFERLVERNNPQPTDRLFPVTHKAMLNNVLTKLELKVDREGQRRSAYSFRHTYICLRLMEGANIFQIAKNCRTSVEMMEKYYASHIKTSIDAAAVNVRRLHPDRDKDAEERQQNKRRAEEVRHGERDESDMDAMARELSQAKRQPAQRLWRNRRMIRGS